MNESELAAPPSSRFAPVLWGAAAIALAENLPGLKLLNWLCCGTIWSGALLAVYLRWRQHPQRGVQFSEAIALGIYAALLGAVLNVAIDYGFKKNLAEVLHLFGENNSDLAEKLRQQLPPEIFQHLQSLMPLFLMVMSLVVHAIMGAIGGMIGATIFPPRPSVDDEENQ